MCLGLIFIPKEKIFINIQLIIWEDWGEGGGSVAPNVAPPPPSHEMGNDS